MNFRQVRMQSYIKRKVLQNILFLASCCVCFYLGNMLATVSLDPTNCSIEMCTEKIKRSSVEDTNQWIGQWRKSGEGPKKYVFLVILILSAPKNQEQRETIRETWLSDELSDTIHYFVIGTSKLKEQLNMTIHSEQKRFNDLLLFNNIEDSYEALSKKILASYVYINLNIKFRFLLKVDDDSYVNLPQLHLDLKSVPYKQRLYWGFFNGQAVPFTKGPWKETEFNLCDRYLPYALGGGYILSDDLVSFIAINSKYLKIYKNEDVGIGIWLAPLDVHKVHDPRFDTEYMSRGCNNKYIITHKQSIMDMRNKFNSLRMSGLLCHREFQVRKSYNYNWNVPPSKCCSRNDSSVP